MAEDIKTRLKSATPVMMASPFYNVANCVYVPTQDVTATLEYIASLERQIEALQTYMDGPPKFSRTGVPITKA